MLYFLTFHYTQTLFKETFSKIFKGTWLKFSRFLSFPFSKYECSIKSKYANDEKRKYQGWSLMASSCFVSAYVYLRFRPCFPIWHIRQFSFLVNYKHRVKFYELPFILQLEILELRTLLFCFLETKGS